jgi:hypothetical protein
MRYKNFILGLVAVAALALLPTAARADALSFAFTPNTYTGAAGSVVTLMGTFTNGPGAITFTGYNASLQSGLSLSPNGNPGSQPFDALVGMPGSSTLGPIPLFNLLIDPGTPDGTVFTFAFNQFIVFYDPSTPGSPDEAAANFQIVVRNGGPNIPEPASIMLLGTGLAGVAAGLRKRWRAKKE